MSTPSAEDIQQGDWEYREYLSDPKVQAINELIPRLHHTLLRLREAHLSPASVMLPREMYPGLRPGITSEINVMMGWPVTWADRIGWVVDA